MDPVQKIWMFENWLADQNDDVELAKNHALFIGAFINPEATKQFVGEGNVHISTDEEFEESSRMVREANIKLLQEKQKTVRKRKRRTLKG